MLKFLKRLLSNVPIHDCQKSGHKWEFLGTSRHFWKLCADGTSTGMYSRIDDLLKLDCLSDESVTFLQAYREAGFTCVHTTLRHYKCPSCGKKAMQEFHEHPHNRNAIGELI